MPTLDDKEGVRMRTLPCPCGLELTGADDEELFRSGREHADSQHPNDNISDDFIRQHVATNARDAAPSGS